MRRKGCTLVFTSVCIIFLLHYRDNIHCNVANNKINILPVKIMTSREANFFVSGFYIRFLLHHEFKMVKKEKWQILHGFIWYWKKKVWKCHFNRNNLKMISKQFKLKKHFAELLNTNAIVLLLHFSISIPSLWCEDRFKHFFGNITLPCFLWKILCVIILNAVWWLDPDRDYAIGYLCTCKPNEILKYLLLRIVFNWYP